jgi:hypothetical protein
MNVKACWKVIAGGHDQAADERGPPASRGLPQKRVGAEAAREACHECRNTQRLEGKTRRQAEQRTVEHLKE